MDRIVSAKSFIAIATIVVLSVTSLLCGTTISKQTTTREPERQSISIPLFANDNIDQTIVEKTINEYRMSGVDIISIKSDSNGRPVMEYWIGSDKAVNVYNVATANLLDVTITSKGITNSFVVKGQTTYIDGVKVDAEITDEDGNVVANCEQEGLVALNSVRNTFKCPYGKPGDYTKHANTYKKVKIDLKKAIIKFTAATLLAFLLKKVPPHWLITVGSVLCDTMISYAIDKSIRSKYISLKLVEKYHKKGWQVEKHKGVTQRTMTIYYSKKCSGKHKELKKYYRVESWK